MNIFSHIITDFLSFFFLTYTKVFPWLLNSAAKHLYLQIDRGEERQTEIIKQIYF